MSSDVSGGVTDTYTYDAEGRMIAAYEAGALQASYDYDGYGRQVSKTEGAATIHMIHDPYDRLIAEHDGSTGAVLREYIYLGLMPVAMIDHSTVTPTTYYIHTDQVMAPQKMTPDQVRGRPMQLAPSSGTASQPRLGLRLWLPVP